jgi:hypothetical protein
MVVLPGGKWSRVAPQPPIDARAADILMVRLAHEDTDLVRQANFHSGPWQVELSGPRLSVRLCHLMAGGAPVLSRLGVDQCAPGVPFASFGERARQSLREGRTIDSVLADFVHNSHKPSRDTDWFRTSDHAASLPRTVHYTWHRIMTRTTDTLEKG